LTRLKPLLAIVPTDPTRYTNYPNFCEKRASLLEIANKLWNLNVEKITDNSLIGESWNKFDVKLYDSIIAEIAQRGSLPKLPEGTGAEWLNATLQLIEPSTSQWEKYAILPNQYGNFKKRNELYVDLGIENVLKADLLKSINVDVRNELLYSGIDAKKLGVAKEKSTANVVALIRDRFASSTSYQSNSIFRERIGNRYYKYSKETLRPIAEYMVGLLPQIKTTGVWDNQEKFRQVADIITLGKVPFVGNISYSDANFWEAPNRIVADYLCAILEECASIEGMNVKMGNIGKEK
ncbi:MAG: hypothetical protein K2H76_07205, partial [Muribaculaceae bacterium]|nr:hypothetical protein [Muribaculaceae bacterium]